MNLLLPILSEKFARAKPITENGFSATTAGVHTLNLQTVHGCDSTVNLTLTVHQPVVTNLIEKFARAKLIHKVVLMLPLPEFIFKLAYYPWLRQYG
jgi:hypothetical protein